MRGCCYAHQTATSGDVPALRCRQRSLEPREPAARNSSARSESRDQLAPQLCRVADIREPDALHVLLRDTSHRFRSHVPQLVDELVSLSIISAIELGSRQKIGLRPVRLVVQKVFREKLLLEPFQSFPFEQSFLQFRYSG